MKKPIIVLPDIFPIMRPETREILHSVITDKDQGVLECIGVYRPTVYTKDRIIIFNETDPTYISIVWPHVRSVNLIDKYWEYIIFPSLYPHRVEIRYFGMD